MVWKGYDTGGGRSNGLSPRNAAVEDDRPPVSRAAHREGDRPRSPKCCAPQLTFASCNTAVGDERPAMLLAQSTQLHLIIPDTPLNKQLAAHRAPSWGIGARLSFRRFKV